MGKKSSNKVPSPCIDVCKFKRGGHCIGCSMTKVQKKVFKGLKRTKQKDAFVTMLIHQQSDLGHYAHWAPAYARKCMKKGARPRALSASKAG